MTPEKIRGNRAGKDRRTSENSQQAMFAEFHIPRSSETLLGPCPPPQHPLEWHA